MIFTNEMGRGARRLIGLGTLLSMSACGGGGDTGGDRGIIPPPAYVYEAPQETGDSWTAIRAESTGMSEALLESMINAVQQGEYPVIDSIAVAHQGSLVLHETIRTELNEFDDWVDNTDPALHALFSVSKSIASILVGISIDQSVIAGTDVSYLSLFPYPDYDNWDERKNEISLHDVLTMQMGLDWNEWDPPYSDPDNQMFNFYDSHVDFSKGLLDLPMATDPGTSFSYNTVSTVSLGQAIENQAPLALIDFAAANLMAPLGISQVEAFRTPTGLPDLGRGIYLTSRDLLKFGQLYLDGGSWNEQQVVSAGWVSKSIVPYLEIGWADPDAMDWQIDGYGYQWWIGHFDFEGQRLDSFAAWGHGEQWLMVIPALQLVIAINSHGWDGRADQTNQVFGLIKRFVLPAVEPV